MILISHRGNINGAVTSEENKPEYVEQALRLGYDVEIDLWYVEGVLYLGHDEPQYEIEYEWLKKHSKKLWVHCKNVNAIPWICNTPLHYFWHDRDTLTLTSKNYIWVYPGKQPVLHSIAVLPELVNEDVSSCTGVCSDYIQNYKK